MSSYSQDDEHDPQLDELHETALVTLEALVSSCSRQMQPYLPSAVSAALRYLKYDPNVVDVEYDEEMGGIQDDNSDNYATEEPDTDDDFEDFEEDGGYSDIDDMSWKVRRCAAKLLYTVISTYGRSSILDDALLYQHIAPVLTARFNSEREESVKLEVVSTMTMLIRKTAESMAVSVPSGFLESGGGSKNSRKRRRRGSDASMADFEPNILLPPAASSSVASPSLADSSFETDLIRLIPTIVQNLVKMWKQASIPLKQASIVLLKHLALVSHGGLTEHLQQIVTPIADALIAPLAVGGLTTATGAAVSIATLQVEILKLTATITETHSSDSLLSFLIALIPGVIGAVSDRNYKVSSEALGAVEQIVKALTPPRMPRSLQDLEIPIRKLYDSVLDCITNTNADLEVRQRAIHVFGILLARTSSEKGSNLLPPDKRAAGLSVLSDRLKNETMRISAVNAIDNIAILSAHEEDIPAAWANDVALELGVQLRKSDRALRSASMEALRSLVLNSSIRSYFDEKTVKGLSEYLLPHISGQDLHFLTLALVILSKLVPGNAEHLVNGDLVTALCSVAMCPLAGSSLKALLLLVKAVGDEGAGAELMKRLLRDVGVNGDSAVVGRAIGTLLVHGGPNLGVKMEDFLTELQTTKDPQRECLALAILGEIGLRMGAKCTLTPELFIAHFDAKSDKVRLTAATSLGNSAAGNVGAYMPSIVKGLDKSDSRNYLFLQTAKEMLQHSQAVRESIAPFVVQLWQSLLAVSEEEDNHAIGAECAGRLALLDPATYIPHFQEFLSSPEAAIRGVVISAFRYTFTDSSETLNNVLRPLIVPLLSKMLQERNLGNRRLALTTLNSAIHNKMEILLSRLGQLLPMVIDDTQIKSDLIREVQMGPFKHKVDEGLELRKSAYETLYATLDAPYARSHVPEFFERILAGIEDEQDIRTISNLMTARLAVIAPEQTQNFLDPLSERYTAILSLKPKETAVKQELEKAQEASIGIFKVTRSLAKAFPGAESSANHHKWKTYMEWARKNFEPQLKSLEAEP